MEWSTGPLCGVAGVVLTQTRAAPCAPWHWRQPVVTVQCGLVTSNAELAELWACSCGRGPPRWSRLADHRSNQRMQILSCQLPWQVRVLGWVCPRLAVVLAAAAAAVAAAPVAPALRFSRPRIFRLFLFTLPAFPVTSLWPAVLQWQRLAALAQECVAIPAMRGVLRVAPAPGPCRMPGLCGMRRPQRAHQQQLARLTRQRPLKLVWTQTWQQRRGV